MQNVRFDEAQTTECEITEIVFSACRTNETRQPRKIGQCDVSFSNRFTVGEEYLAIVRGWGGAIVGSAIIDKFDC